MGDRVYITWTIQNIITITLMVLIAGLLVNAGAIGYQKAFAK